jgi:hypothetical protein
MPPQSFAQRTTIDPEKGQTEITSSAIREKQNKNNPEKGQISLAPSATRVKRK